MNYHTLFLLLKPFAFWIKFDTLESISSIPEDKQNLIDFCPICMTKLGTKSTREHKKHDLIHHGRTEKQKVQEMLRGCFAIWIVSGYIAGILVVVVMVANVSEESQAVTISYPAEVDNFIKGCQIAQWYVNEKINATGLTPELFDVINKEMGTCFERYYVLTLPDYLLAERYYNMTGKHLLNETAKSPIS